MGFAVKNRILILMIMSCSGFFSGCLGTSSSAKFDNSLLASLVHTSSNKSWRTPLIVDLGQADVSSADNVDRDHDVQLVGPPALASTFPAASFFDPDGKFFSTFNRRDV